jgi:hypothetical protein
MIMKSVYSSKSVLPGQGLTAKPGLPISDEAMNLIIKSLAKLGLSSGFGEAVRKSSLF